jgi:hypothetical protein
VEKISFLLIEDQYGHLDCPELPKIAGHFAADLGEPFSMDCITGSIERLPLGVSRQPLLNVFKS